MLVRSGCVGPHYVVPAVGGGEGWVGRPLDALVDVLGAQKQLFRVPTTAGGHRSAFSGSRFPVSDEFSAYWKTLDFDSNRMNFFEFSSSHFSRKWKLFGQSMEMSGMTLRIDWKCSRVSPGPASGRNPLVKCGLDTSAPFFRVSGI